MFLCCRSGGGSNMWFTNRITARINHGTCSTWWKQLRLSYTCINTNTTCSACANSNTAYVKCVESKATCGTAGSTYLVLFQQICFQPWEAAIVWLNRTRIFISTHSCPQGWMYFYISKSEGLPSGARRDAMGARIHTWKKKKNTSAAMVTCKVIFFFFMWKCKLLLHLHLTVFLVCTFLFLHVHPVQYRYRFVIFRFYSPVQTPTCLIINKYRWCPDPQRLARCTARTDALAEVPTVLEYWE